MLDMLWLRYEITMEPAMEIVWKNIKGQYGSHEAGFVGKWEIFQISWRSGSQSEIRKAESDYNLTCRLPGIKDHLGAFDFDGAKAKAAKVFEYWHKNLCAETPK